MADTEEPKRKAHTKEVLRELFAKSGNMCASPTCSAIMITAKGDFVGQICHIEGVKGERFRLGMSNEDRAAVTNLMLLCYPHHIETNDESVWTVDRLRKMKCDHEALFTDPGTAMYRSYIDRTAQKAFTPAATTRRLCEVLGWGSEAEHLRETAADVNALFTRVETLDIQTRIFIVAVVERARRVRNTSNVDDRSGHLLLRWEDFTSATGISDEEVKKRIEALETHSLGTHDEIDLGERSALAIKLYWTPNGQWDLWSSLAEFCEKANESLHAIVVNLELSRLD